jgi:hypothetical protein
VLQRAAAVLVEQRKDLVDHVGRVGDSDMEARCAELFFVDEPILVHVEHVKQTTLLVGEVTHRTLPCGKEHEEVTLRNLLLLHVIKHVTLMRASAQGE